jgi:hypothetical protein
LCGGLALDLAYSEHWRLISATDAIPPPEPKPRTMREHFVVPSIRSREVARAEWPNIGCLEHFLYLLDLVNDAFNVHARFYIQYERGNRQTERHL